MTIQIAKYRKLAGYTQKEFAQLLNVKPNTYNQWETGKHQIDFESLIKIADILNITLDQLFDRNITKRNETKRNGTERNETKRNEEESEQEQMKLFRALTPAGQAAAIAMIKGLLLQDNFKKNTANPDLLGK